MLIGISGKRGSGKDLLGSILVGEHGFKRFSFAQSLKKHVRDFMNLTEEQTDGELKEKPTAYVRGDWSCWTPRELMIEVGQFYRKFDSNFWVRKVLPYALDERNACITDVRFNNEAEAIRSAGGLLVRLERKPELNIYKGELNDATETELDGYSFDYVLGSDFNITPADLQHFAKGVLSHTNAHAMP
jgi:hypothetical protein